MLRLCISQHLYVVFAFENKKCNYVPVKFTYIVIHPIIGCPATTCACDLSHCNLVKWLCCIYSKTRWKENLKYIFFHFSNASVYIKGMCSRNDCCDAVLFCLIMSHFVYVVSHFAYLVFDVFHWVSYWDTFFYDHRCAFSSLASVNAHESVNFLLSLHLRSRYWAAGCQTIQAVSLVFSSMYVIQFIHKCVIINVCIN
jgi:hypothetical protein